jgi:hypothetical protein
MVGVPTEIIDVNLLFDDDLGVTHFGDQIKSDILEAQEACEVQWSPA